MTENRIWVHFTLSKKRICIEHVNAQLKVFRIVSGRYRNRRRRFGLCCNLIAAITTKSMPNQLKITREI